jgi:hypothetical protein
MGVVLIGEIAGVATAFAVFIAAGGLFAQTRARKFGLAQVYIQRYWTVDEFFLLEGCSGPHSANARRYLRLCEDEFDAARQGWVDIAVWRAWHEGIRLQVAELGLDISKYDQLKRCIDQGDHEPTKCIGLGKTGWRRKVSWWFESLFGS